MISVCLQIFMGAKIHYLCVKFKNYTIYWYFLKKNNYFCTTYSEENDTSQQYKKVFWTAAGA